MLPTKFLNLKHLSIQISGWTLSPSYDYFSLVSFLDASPSLETWYLNVRQCPFYILQIMIFDNSLGFISGLSSLIFSSGISERYEA
jgi:hypothetical protein